MFAAACVNRQVTCFLESTSERLKGCSLISRSWDDQLLQSWTFRTHVLVVDAEEGCLRWLMWPLCPGSLPSMVAPVGLQWRQQEEGWSCSWKIASENPWSASGWKSRTRLLLGIPLGIRITSRPRCSSSFPWYKHKLTNSPSWKPVVSAAQELGWGWTQNDPCSQRWEQLRSWSKRLHLFRRPWMGSRPHYSRWGWVWLRCWVHRSRDTSLQVRYAFYQ